MRASAACSWSRWPWTAKYSTAGEPSLEAVVVEQATELVSEMAGWPASIA